MAEIDVSTGHAIWSGALTLATGIMGYLLKKRDAQIDKLGDANLASERAHSALELKVAEQYATKDSLSVLFQETQRTNKESNDRLEKRIDETKADIGKIDDKLDRMGSQILTELSKKT